MPSFLKSPDTSGQPVELEIAGQDEGYRLDIPVIAAHEATDIVQTSIAIIRALFMRCLTFELSGCRPRTSRCYCKGRRERLARSRVRLSRGRRERPPMARSRWLNPAQGELKAKYAILDDRARPYYEHRLAA